MNTFKIDTTMKTMIKAILQGMCCAIVLLLLTQPLAGQTLVQKVNSYDAYGNALEVEDVNGAITKYYYGSSGAPYTQNGHNGINGVYLTGIIKVQNGVDSPLCSSDDLCTSAIYDDKGRLLSITDENEHTVRFDYDSFGRLVGSYNANNKLVSTNNYFYSSLETGVFNSNSPNAVTSVSTNLIDNYSFGSSSGWSSNGDAAFGVSYAGETTLKLGANSSGSWSYARKYIGTEDFVSKVDFYPTSSTNDNAYVHEIFAGSERFIVIYRGSTDRFDVYYKYANGSSGTESAAFSLVAPPNNWYTIEIEKNNNGTFRAWVYPKGEIRNSDGDMFEKSGFSSTGAYVRFFSKIDHIYFANYSVTKGVKSTNYLDGLGRAIQSQVSGGSKTIVTGTKYNDRGLPEAVSRPIELASQTTFVTDLFEGTGSFSATGGLGADSKVAEYYDGLGVGADADYAFSYTQYENSPFARVEKSTLPGDTLKKGSYNEITTTYGLNTDTSERFTIDGKEWARNKLSKTVTEDPDSNFTITYTDGWGQTIASGVDMNGDGKLDGLNKDSCTSDDCDLITEFAYDLLGNLIRVEDPRGLATTYTYNALGQLTSKKLPDQADSVNYMYDKKGRLRFVENAAHKEVGSSIIKSLTSQSQAGDVSDDVTVLKSGILAYDIDTNPEEYSSGFVVEIKNLGQLLINNLVQSDAGYYMNVSRSLMVNAGTYSLDGYVLGGYTATSGGSSGTYSFTPFKYSYTKYDDLDRPIETGEYYGSTSFNSADEDDQSFPSSDKQALVNYFYDETNACSGATNLAGRLAKAEFADPNDLDISGTTCYSYNNLGLVAWVSQQIPGLSSKKIHYSYDELGRITRMRFDGDGWEDHYIWYEYDELGRLEKVKSYVSNNENLAFPEAEYTYYADGQVKELNLGDGTQIIDYDYTVQGWMSAINNGNISGSDKFGLSLVYYKNGNVKQQNWKQASLDSQSNTYNYNYDNANRIESADFINSNYNSGSYDVDYQYDKNGNIDSINRGSFSIGGEYVSGQYYEYPVFTNNYDLVVSGISNKVTSVDSDNFAYDAMGNTTESELKGIDNTSYDWRNLPTWIVANGEALLYTYDADGQRVKKQVVDGNAIYYIRGADGQTIAAYDGNGDLLFINIVAGGDIIGQIIVD